MTATKKLYIWLAAIIVGLQSFMAFSNASLRLEHYVSKFNLVMMFVMVGVGLAYIFLIDNHRLRSNIIFLGLLFLLLVLFRKTYILQLVTMLILFMPLSPVDVFDAYRKGISISILITFITGNLIGQMYNTTNFTGVYTFGYSNENQIGFYSAFLVVAWLFKIDDGRLYLSTSWIKNLFYILLIGYEYFFIEDNTAIAFLIVMLLLVYTKKFFKRGLYYLSIVIPGGLMYLSYWMAINYADTNWTYKLNQIVTMRPQIWNWYYTHYPISLWGGNQIRSVVSKFGYNYTPGQGLFDGSYAYVLYSYGILFSIIFIIGLMMANIALIKNNMHYLFFIMISLELVGFSENFTALPALSFGIIFAMLSFNFGWFSQINGNDNDRENL